MNIKTSHNSCLQKNYIFFFKNQFYLFIYFWLRWVFVAVCRLSLVVASGGYSSLWSTGSRRTGFSSCGMRAQYFCLAGSVVVANQA